MFLAKAFYSILIRMFKLILQGSTVLLMHIISGIDEFYN